MKRKQFDEGNISSSHVLLATCHKKKNIYKSNHEFLSSSVGDAIKWIKTSFEHGLSWTKGVMILKDNKKCKNVLFKITKASKQAVETRVKWILKV